MEARRPALFPRSHGRDAQRSPRLGRRDGASASRARTPTGRIHRSTRCVGPSTAHRWLSGESCSDSRRSCSTSRVTPSSTPPTSTAGRRQLTTSCDVIGIYERFKRRFSSISRRARSSTFTVVRSDRERTSVRRSPCGTRATCSVWPLTKATTGWPYARTARRGCETTDQAPNLPTCRPPTYCASQRPSISPAFDV